MRYLRVMSVLVGLAMAIGACGDAGSEDDLVRAAATEGLTSDDTDICTSRLTARYLEQATAKRGSAAQRACRHSIVTRQPRSVSITRIAISGPRAGVDVRLEGGYLPLLTARLGLRRRDGRWRIDRLKGGTLDRRYFFRITGDQLRRAIVLPAAADCVLRSLKPLSDAEIVALVVSPIQVHYAVTAFLCGARAELLHDGRLPRSVVDCIMRAMRHEVSTGPTARRLAATDNPLEVLGTPRVRRKVNAAAVRCALAPRGPSDGPLALIAR